MSNKSEVQATEMTKLSDAELELVKGGASGGLIAGGGFSAGPGGASGAFGGAMAKAK